MHQIIAKILSLYGISLSKCMFIILIGLSMSVYASDQKEVGLMEQQNLLVSIHPMALLIKSAWPELKVSSLVKANQSPHDFVLKPSDISRIKSVDAVVWMGADFEPYLKNVIRGMAQVDVSKVLRKDDHAGHEGHEGHEDKQHKSHNDMGRDVHTGHEHDHDPHLWLAPASINPIISLVQKELGLPDPVAFLTSFDAWLVQAHKQLGKSQKIGFVSFHGAYDEWIAAFNLNQLAAVTSNPEKPVGTRHIVEVRKILESGRANCLFVEPQFQSRIVTKLHQGLDISVINIDPMASNYEISDAGFISYYEELLSNFTQCLTK
jgi:zinc transport system substrate-binding protein